MHDTSWIIISGGPTQILVDIPVNFELLLGYLEVLLHAICINIRTNQLPEIRALVLMSEAQDVAKLMDDNMFSCRSRKFFPVWRSSHMVG